MYLNQEKNDSLWVQCMAKLLRNVDIFSKTEEKMNNITYFEFEVTKDIKKSSKCNIASVQPKFRFELPSELGIFVI